MVKTTRSSASSSVKAVLKSLKKDKVGEIKDATEKLNSEIKTKTYQSDCFQDAQGIIKFLDEIPETQSLQVFINAVSNLGADVLKECREILKSERQKEKREYGSSELKAEAVAKKMLVIIQQLDAHIVEANKLKSAVLMNFLKHYYNFSLKNGRCDNSVLDGLMETRLREIENSSSSDALNELTKMMGKTQI